MNPNVSALDKIDLSRITAFAGMDQAVVKSGINAAAWQIFEANSGHVIMSVWGFHVTWNYARGAVALLFGPEPTPSV